MTNPKTTWTGIASAITALLTTLAALPDTLGPVAELYPATWKPKIVIVGLISTLVLRSWKSFLTADAPPSPSAEAQAILQQTGNALK